MLHALGWSVLVDLAVEQRGRFPKLLSQPCGSPKSKLSLRKNPTALIGLASRLRLLKVKSSRSLGVVKKEVSKQLGGDLTFMNGFLLLLGLLPIWMVILLARHLRRFPTGDLRAKPDNKKVEWEEEGTVFDSVLVGASREVTARPLRSLWRRCFGYLA